MLADFYIPRLSNDINIAVQKIIYGVKFCTEVWTLLKKRPSKKTANVGRHKNIFSRIHNFYNLFLGIGKR